MKKPLNYSRGFGKKVEERGVISNFFNDDLRFLNKKNSKLL